MKMQLKGKTVDVYLSEDEDRQGGVSLRVSEEPDFRQDSDWWVVSLSRNGILTRHGDCPMHLFLLTKDGHYVATTKD
jgi:hypothetical protein